MRIIPGKRINTVWLAAFIVFLCFGCAMFLAYWISFSQVGYLFLGKTVFSSGGGVISVLHATAGQTRFAYGHYRVTNLASFKDEAKLYGAVKGYFYFWGLGWAHGDYDPFAAPGLLPLHIHFFYLSVPYWLIISCTFFLAIAAFAQWRRSVEERRIFEVVVALPGRQEHPIRPGGTGGNTLPK